MAGQPLWLRYVWSDSLVTLAVALTLALLAQLLRQYMHNTEIAVTMRLSTILKTIKQPL